jgi:hypothetical protein
MPRPSWQVCRCMPFIHTMMRLDELVSLKDMRAVVKEKFKEYKDVTDPRVRACLLGVLHGACVRHMRPWFIVPRLLLCRSLTC